MASPSSLSGPLAGPLPGLLHATQELLLNPVEPANDASGRRQFHAGTGYEPQSAPTIPQPAFDSLRDTRLNTRPPLQRPTLRFLFSGMRLRQPLV